MKTYINKINGISYRISMEEILYSQAKTLFHAIETIPYEKIRDGYKIEIGFSVFILVKNFDLVKILLLPYNYIVILRNDDVLEILNEKDESIIEDNH